MLNLKLIKQTPGYCGPACAKMVLDYYGFEKSEEFIARAIGATHEDGCDPWEIVRGMKKLGFKSFYKKSSSLKEVQEYLNKNIPVIIDWNPRGYGHYSVIVAITPKRVYFADPKKDKIVFFTKAKFLSRWFEFYKKKKVFREIIVIFPKS